MLQLIHFKEKRVFPMKYNTCPHCKAKVSAELAQCPECGHTFGTRKNRIPVVFGSCLLIAAFAGGLAFNLGSEFHTAVSSPAPEIIETLAPATPVPTQRLIRSKSMPLAVSWTLMALRHMSATSPSPYLLIPSRRFHIRKLAGASATASYYL